MSEPILLGQFLEWFDCDHLPSRKDVLKRTCFLIYEKPLPDETVSLDSVIETVYSEVILVWKFNNCPVNSNHKHNLRKIRKFFKKYQEYLSLRNNITNKSDAKSLKKLEDLISEDYEIVFDIKDKNFKQSGMNEADLEFLAASLNSKTKVKNKSNSPAESTEQSDTTDFFYLNSSMSSCSTSSFNCSTECSDSNASLSSENFNLNPKSKRVKNVNVHEYLTKKFDRELDINVYYQLLTKCPDLNFQPSSLKMPKSGEIFLIRTKEPNVKDFKDSCKFNRKQCYQTKETNVTRSVHYVLTENKVYSKDFVKYVFSLGNLCVVHYVGDQSLAILKPHGNCKSGKNHISTKKETFAKIQSNLKESKSNVKVCNLVKNELKKEDVNASLVNENCFPKPKQVAYQRSKITKEMVVFADDVMNLQLLKRSGLENFIHEITIEENLRVVLYEDEILKLAKRIFEYSLENQEPVVVSYDTTFNLTTYYVSILCMKNIEFEEEPLVPIFYFIHQRRYGEEHEFNWEHVITKLLTFHENIGITTDRERAIINSIKKILEKKDIANNLFFCNNHILKNIDHWIGKRILDSSNFKTILSHCDSIAELLRSGKLKPNDYFGEEQFHDEMNDVQYKEEKFFDKSGNEYCAEELEDPESFCKFKQTILDDLDSDLQEFKRFKGDAKELVRCGAIDKFRSQYEKYSSRWPAACRKYFDAHIFDALENNLSKISKFDFQDCLNNFPTSNLSESENAALKRFLNFKELPLDMLALELYNYTAELIDKFNDSYDYKSTGEFTLKADFIPERFSLKLKSLKYIDFPSQIKEINKEFSSFRKCDPKPRNLSQLMIAEKAVKEKLVYFESLSGTFIVDNPFSKRSFGAVRFDENQKLYCNCSFNKNCFHKLAVELSIFKKVDYNHVSFADYDFNKVDVKNKVVAKSGCKGKEEVKKKKFLNSLAKRNPKTYSRQKKSVSIKLEPIEEDLSSEESLYQIQDNDDHNDHHSVNPSDDEDCIPVSVQEVEGGFQNSESKFLKVKDNSASLDYLLNNLHFKDDFEGEAVSLLKKINNQKKDTNWFSNHEIQAFLDKSLAEYRDSDTIFISPIMFYDYSLILTYFLRLKAKLSTNLILSVFLDSPDGKHWITGAIVLSKKIIFILDSLYRKSKNYSSNFGKLSSILNLYLQSKNLELNLNEWTFKVAKDSPKQGNDYDCGPCSCSVSKCIIEKEPLSNKKIDGQKFRKEFYESLIEVDEKSNFSATLLNKTTKKPNEFLNQMAKTNQFDLDEEILSKKEIDICTIEDLNAILSRN